MIAIIPPTPGTYALLLNLPQPCSLKVGKLGKFCFAAGVYVYVGSAFGPGGLRARVGRHLRGDGRPHWHIDALRAVASVQGILYAITPHPLECLWSQAIANLPAALIPAPGFGASDCHAGCAAHLVAFPNNLNLDQLKKTLDKVTDAPVVAAAL